MTKEWKDEYSCIIDKYSNDFSDRCDAWDDIIPEIGKLLGFKLQSREYNETANPRLPSCTRKEYRVVRKDLLNRVKDKLDD